MELTALILDNRSKKAKQFSLPVIPEKIASEFGYDKEDILFTIQSIEELPKLKVEGATLSDINKLAEKLKDVEDFVVLSVIETESSDPSYLVSYDFDVCWVYRGIGTDRDFGKFLIEEVGIELSKEKLLSYFDYEKYGRDVRLSQRGIFVDKGCFIKRGFN